MNEHTDLINMPDKAIRPGQRDSGLKQYVCPYCQSNLIKGNIKKLKMACPHCQKMIDADEKDLIKK